MHDLSTTLAAVATAPGRGGIGCVRISGPRAHDIAARLVRSKSPIEWPDESRPRFVTFIGADGEALDHGFVVGFGGHASFTGEPVVELWAHGSPPVLEALVRAAEAAGATRAGPGEFTYRAVRHGRLDLPRAEAIRDLVAARTLYQARVAFLQINGALARRLAPLRDGLIDLVARGEAAIEFADEAETQLGAGRLASALDEALALANGLVADARRGRLVRAGARVTLAGVTSVGKSSLFNRLLGRDRAITSPIPGTTRDTLEESIDLDGIPIVLVDTAGLQAVANEIEAEGVRRARAAAGAADLLVVVLDASRELREDERETLVGHATELGRPMIVVANKSDLVPAGRSVIPWPDAIPVSARTGGGIDALCAAIRRSLAGADSLEDPAITDTRHEAAVEAAAAALARARAALPLGEEIALEEIREALRALGEITGELANDQLYDRIFSTFCIGK